MLRILMAGLAMLAASGCVVGLPSAVDAAPFADRMARAPFADGVYCGIDKVDDGGQLVKSSGEDREKNCAAVIWDVTQRQFMLRDPQGEAPDIGWTPADLGGGLFLLQWPIDDAQRDDAPFRYWLMVGAAHGDAVAFLPLPSDARVDAAAARYPGVMLSIHAIANPRLPPPPAEAGDEADPQPQTQDVRYIAAGSAADVRALARDLTLDLVAELMGAAAEENLPASHYVPILVRDVAGAEDHPPTPAQQRDIDAIMETLKRAAERP